MNWARLRLLERHPHGHFFPVKSGTPPVYLSQDLSIDGIKGLGWKKEWRCNRHGTSHQGWLFNAGFIIYMNQVHQVFNYGQGRDIELVC